MEDINNVLTFHREKAGLAYAESISAVQFLIENYGEYAVPEIARYLAAGLEPDSAFIQMAGIDFNMFQKNWFDEMRVKYRWGFLLEVPLLLSALMVIAFFSALIAVVKRSRLKRKEWEEEEAFEKESQKKDTE